MFVFFQVWEVFCCYFFKSTFCPCPILCCLECTDFALWMLSQILPPPPCCVSPELPFESLGMQLCEGRSSSAVPAGSLLQVCSYWLFAEPPFTPQPKPCTDRACHDSLPCPCGHPVQRVCGCTEHCTCVFLSAVNKSSSPCLSVSACSLRQCLEGAQQVIVS